MSKIRDLSNRVGVSLYYEVRTEVVKTYEVDPDHFKQATGVELYDATARDLEDYVLYAPRVIHYDHAGEHFLEETLQDDWTLEN